MPIQKTRFRDPTLPPIGCTFYFVERSVNEVMTNVSIIWCIRFIDDFRFQELRFQVLTADYRLYLKRMKLYLSISSVFLYSK